MESKSVPVLPNNQAPVQFLTEAGYKLNMSEMAIASAAFYYHKFKSTMSLQCYDIHLVLMATLNLAAKVQEESARLGDVVNVCYRCWHKEESPLEIGELYWRLKDSVAAYELLLLRALKFDAQIQLPHSHLLHFLLALSRWVDEGVWSKSHVTRVAWALLQDSFYDDLCLSHSPVAIAIAVVYTAVCCCKVEVPCDANSTSWWTVMCPHINEHELQLIGTKIMKLYH